MPFTENQLGSQEYDELLSAYWGVIDVGDTASPAIANIDDEGAQQPNKLKRRSVFTSIHGDKKQLLICFKTTLDYSTTQKKTTAMN